MNKNVTNRAKDPQMVKEAHAHACTRVYVRRELLACAEKEPDKD